MTTPHDAYELEREAYANGHVIRCTNCFGAKRMGSDDCPVCHGEGTIPVVVEERVVDPFVRPKKIERSET